MEYTLDYFIDFFSQIPEEKWITNIFSNNNGNCCANGHLGVSSTLTPTHKSTILAKLTKDICVHYSHSGLKVKNVLVNYSSIIAAINNGRVKEYQQSTPKQRVLAALHDLKAQQSAVEVTQLTTTI